MHPLIFINYRRDDCGTEALLLREVLQAELGFDSVFLDTSSIQPGQVWPEGIEQALKNAKIVLALIGPRWFASDNNVSRRIDSEEDWVRKELAITLENQKELIPVLVRGMQMPSAKDLPDSLKTMWRIQAVTLQHERWDDNKRTIIDHLHKRLRLDQSILPDTTALPVTESLSPRRTPNRQSSKKLLDLMNELEATWIKGVLHQSLERVAWIDLKLDWTADQVETPSNKLRLSARQSVEAISSDQSIATVFDDAQRKLLILGDPGSGKTTTLLKLAESLLAKTRENSAESVPVALPLNKWTGKHRRFERWILDQIKEWYKIQPAIASEWIAAGRIFLLLDGLDEVPAMQRAACVDAINHFLSNAGANVPGIVITCRPLEYACLPTRLQLRDAIALRPLTTPQIDAYLQNAGPKLAPLRAALAQDDILANLATTPFMLSVLILAYSGAAPPAAAPAISTTERRAQIFNDYVKAAFRRPDKPKDDHLTDSDTCLWLAKLAKQMTSRQTKFVSAETLQPAWLDNYLLQFLYFVATRLPLAWILTIVAFSLTNRIADWRIIAFAQGAGLLFGALDFAAACWKDWFLSSRTVRLLGGVVGCGAFYFAFDNLIPQPARPPNALLWGLGDFFGLLIATGFAAAALPTLARADTEDIRAYTTVGWSWRVAGRRTLFAVSSIPTCFFLVDLVFVRAVANDLQNHATPSAIGCACGVALAVFLLKRRILQRSFLGFLFFINCALGGLFAGLLLALPLSEITSDFFEMFLLVIPIVPFAGLEFKMSGSAEPSAHSLWFWIKGPLKATAACLISSGILLLILRVIAVPDDLPDLKSVLNLFAFITGVALLRFGGLNGWKHFCLRWLLVCTRRLPRRLSAFLDYAAKLILLRRRGSSYEFIHAVFLDHFATSPIALHCSPDGDCPGPFTR